jgi:hypothetical protein
VAILASLKTRLVTKEPVALAMAKYTEHCTAPLKTNHHLVLFLPSTHEKDSQCRQLKASPTSTIYLNTSMRSNRFSTTRNISSNFIMLILMSLFVSTQCLAADMSVEQMEAEVTSCVVSGTCKWLDTAIWDEDIQFEIQDFLKKKCLTPYPMHKFTVRACFYAGKAYENDTHRVASLLFLTACKTKYRTDYRTTKSCHSAIDLACKPSDTNQDCQELNNNARSAEKLINAICTHTAEIEAESLASARLAQEVGAVKAKAETRWASTGRRLSTCVKAEDINVRKQCLIQAHQFIRVATSLEARLNEGVESITTSCGVHKIAIPARTQRVVVSHLVKMAQQHVDALERSLLNKKQNGTRLSFDAPTEAISPSSARKYRDVDSFVDKSGVNYGMCFGLSTTCAFFLSFDVQVRTNRFVYGLGTMVVVNNFYGGIYPTSSSNFSLRFGVHFLVHYRLGASVGLNYELWRNDKLATKFEVGVSRYPKDGIGFVQDGIPLGNAYILPNLSVTGYL